MNIDDDDFDDDYDFAESDEEAHRARQAAQKEASRPYTKYMDILQKVANREHDEITIELDDLAEVFKSTSRVWPC
jgi:DNA replication licensing factor MCM7